MAEFCTVPLRMHTFYFTGFLTALILLSSVNVINTSPTTLKTQYKWDPTYDDLMADLSKYPCGTHGLLRAISTLQCATACSERPWCTSFFYRGATGDCQLHSPAFEKFPFDVVNASGSHFYTSSKEWCPVSEGYTHDSLSGLCYKIHPTVASSIDSRSLCAQHGDVHITLDTHHKMQHIMATLAANTDYDGHWFHVGAFRHLESSSATHTGDYFVWECTSRALAMTYFFPNQPDLSAAEQCIDMTYSPSHYDFVTKFAAFADGTCYFPDYFICERL